MRVLLAGATGALGVPLVRRLTAAGHEVIGITRSDTGAERLASLGASSVPADVMDRDQLLRAVDGVAADAVIHELTALKKPPAHHRQMTATNELRTTGTVHLVEAARAVGAHRFLTQSIFFGYGYRDHGSRQLTEDDPFGDLHGDAFDPHVAAMASTEQQASSQDGIDGISLRYGLFYGADIGGVVAMLRKRALPVPRHGGELAFVHHEDAAAATVAALEQGRAGAAYNIVDDTPATWRDFVTEIASTHQTPAPLTLPGWLLRTVAPYAGVMMTGVSMRVSNAKAKRELGWQPTYPSYRTGLAAG